jgi:hypothetical protein
VPFHIQIKRSFHVARAFNLSEGELRALLSPWSRGEEVELGDRRWVARESTVTVLEGPGLDAQQLGFGQGWQNAVRAGDDVTQALLRAPVAVPVLAQTDRGARTAVQLLAGVGLRSVEWTGPPAAGPGVIVVGDAEMTAGYALQVGSALGSMGGRAVVVDAGAATLPDELRAQAVRADDAAAFAERLR